MGLRLLLPPQSCRHRLLPQSCQHRLLRLLVEELAMAHLSSRRLVLAMAQELALAHLSSRRLVLAMARESALAHLWLRPSVLHLHHPLQQLHSLVRFQPACLCFYGSPYHDDNGSPSRSFGSPLVGTSYGLPPTVL